MAENDRKKKRTVSTKSRLSPRKKTLTHKKAQLAARDGKKKGVLGKKPRPAPNKPRTLKPVPPKPTGATGKLGLRPEGKQVPATETVSYTVDGGSSQTCQFQRDVTIFVPVQEKKRTLVFSSVLATPEEQPPTGKNLTVTKWLINLTVTESPKWNPAREFNPPLEVTIKNVPAGCDKLILLDDPQAYSDAKNWSWLQGSWSDKTLTVQVSNFKGKDPQMDV